MISSNDGVFFPNRSLDRATAEALAAYCELHFPLLGRRKSVMVEWGLRDDEARSVIEGSASKATLDRVWKHPNGGWRVLLPVMGAVVGHSADTFIIQEKTRLENERRTFEAREARLGQMARDLRAVVPVALPRAD